MIIQKTYKLLDRKAKISFFQLVLLNLIKIILEILTLGSIIPLLSGFLDFKVIEDNVIFERITLIFFNEYNQTSFIVVLILFLIMFTFFKFIFQLIIVSHTSRIQLNLTILFQKRVLRNYLNKNLDFYLLNNSSYLLRQTTSEIRDIVSKIIIPMSEIFCEAILIISFFILIMAHDPLTLIIIIPSIIILIYISRFLTKKRVKHLAEKRYKMSLESFKIVYETFVVIRELLINKINKNQITNNYINKTTKLYNYERLIEILNNFPRFLFEFIIIIALSLYIILRLHSSQTFEEIIISLSLFAAVGIKMIPSLSKIARSIQLIEVGAPVFYMQHSFIDEINDSYKYRTVDIQFLEFKDKISFKELSYTYKNKNNKVFQNINLTLKKNYLTCIKGESGTGKTTLGLCLLNILKPKGYVKIDEKKEINLDDISKSFKIGYVDQTVKLLDNSLEYNITFKNDLNNDEFNRLEYLIETCGLKKLRDDIFNRNIKTLGEDSKFISGGEKQRISIARTLFLNPDFIIFDEPTSSLDLENQKKIMELIKKIKTNKIIVVISHDIKFDEVFDEIYNLSEGKLNQLK